MSAARKLAFGAGTVGIDGCCAGAVPGTAALPGAGADGCCASAVPGPGAFPGAGVDGCSCTCEALLVCRGRGGATTVTESCIASGAGAVAAASSPTSFRTAGTNPPARCGAVSAPTVTGKAIASDPATMSTHAVAALRRLPIRLAAIASTRILRSAPLIPDTHTSDVST